MNTQLIELLKKYDVPAPRYTSYPTVPVWTEKIGAGDYGQKLENLRTGEALSLYYHLPFCERLCHFCGCMQVITQRRERSQEYTDVLLSEMELVAGHIPPSVRDVCQIQLGGGTPNFFKPEEIETILRHIHKHFHVLPDAEIAIEMHPKTSTESFCDKLRELKFNRISLGIQDFDPKVQELIYRFQSYETTRKMIDYLRGLGFDAFNFDLIYGLPGQSLKGWSKTLDRVLGLRPNRLAIYSYAHVPWVRPVQRSFKDSDIPPAEMKLKLFEKAYTTLTENGYRHIGMDHFALKDDGLSTALEEGTIHRNFMGYSTKAHAHQIGFGMSSISFAGGHYFQNSKELPAYYEAIKRGELATFRGYLLNHEDRLRRDLITQIMCRSSVDIEAFEKKWQIQFQTHFADNIPLLSEMMADQLVSINHNELRATNYGVLLLRNIAMAFDPYLQRVKEGAKNPVFSRSV
ncbi:MAG: oxygen-independent coproporphyrinogen III oxidase [Deltaproteobacteria bacterium RIFCSPLOWO2_02_FULL_50_16]|nr:MAG: oxygen-independent coproporphyrinogen III oxidase [Deltaproteobacteria bacterium RIFCSPLOWO2_02_FULL_50_16]OGQ67927.1 MAG: oxygen-independent coproporphyrinogen III oxidase [Deltaproteobacteria bacterium RIFCSPLOWO2_12_FULL_50_11]